MNIEEQTKDCRQTTGTTGTKIDVDVVATRHEDKGVDFVCTWQDGNGPWYSGPIVLPRQSGERDIEFKLDDKTGLKLNFETSANSAIWIKEGSCPTSGHGNDDKGQIKDKQVDTNDKKLTLKNLNTEECVLHYALRFTGDSWTSASGVKHEPPYVYDPEFRNGGGTML
jgi:hypothetical protein